MHGPNGDAIILSHGDRIYAHSERGTVSDGHAEPDDRSDALMGSSTAATGG